jgi:hypothetical protein
MLFGYKHVGSIKLYEVKKKRCLKCYLDTSHGTVKKRRDALIMLLNMTEETAP